MGAPKGNSNALKHGFYSRTMRKSEIADLKMLEDAGIQANLVDEIALMRVTIQRTLVLAEGINDLDTAIRWLEVLGASATRIATLLRTQSLLTPTGQTDLDAISQAIAQLTVDWRLTSEERTTT